MAKRYVLILGEDTLAYSMIIRGLASALEERVNQIKLCQNSIETEVQVFEKNNPIKGIRTSQSEYNTKNNMRSGNYQRTFYRTTHK